MTTPPAHPTVPLLELTDSLGATRILVIGDLILDHYVVGAAERLSPEAPVPVVHIDSEHEIPGGAANVARNTAALGAATTCIGVVGGDDAGRRLRQSMTALGIDTTAIVEDAARPTTIKTRVMSHGQQMLRLDRETCEPVSPSVADRIRAGVCAALPGHQAVVVSDYGKGLLAPPLLAAIIREARSAGIPVFVDPKGTDYTRYAGATALTPNSREAAAAAGVTQEPADWLSQAASRIQSNAATDYLVITRGADGFALFLPSETHLIPATAREVYDVTGAGDTFIAFLAMASAAGLDPLEACRVANAAAGIVVGKVGAATVAAHELRAALAPGARGRKLRGASELAALGDELRAAGKNIVFTNGCFDFLHAGHVAMLQQARQLGDTLVVATNTDDVIARLKGAPRPVVKQDQRETLLASIEAVDFVVPFGDETPHAVLRALRPHILVKGDNYATGEVEGREIVEEYGGKVVLLPTLESISTAELVSRRKN